MLHPRSNDLLITRFWNEFGTFEVSLHCIEWIESGNIVIRHMFISCSLGLLANSAFEKGSRFDLIFGIIWYHDIISVTWVWWVNLDLIWVNITVLIEEANSFPNALFKLRVVLINLYGNKAATEIHLEVNFFNEYIKWCVQVFLQVYHTLTDELDNISGEIGLLGKQSKPHLSFLGLIMYMSNSLNCSSLKNEC